VPVGLGGGCGWEHQQQREERDQGSVHSAQASHPRGVRRFPRLTDDIAPLPVHPSRKIVR
jgi:hypothetical protein